jgi:AcrR family transcriptional regulator
MNSTDTDKQAETTREEILRHASELFTHYGFWKTNVGDIATRCGMSPGNLYRYYRNKQAIGLAVVEKFFEMSETAMETGLILPTGTPESRIRMLIETGVGHLVNEMQQNPKIVELADFLCSDEEGIALLQRHIAWKRARMVRELGRGIEQRQFRDADPQKTAATILMATKVFWTPPAMAQWRDKDTILPELREVLDLIFDGINRK